MYIICFYDKVMKSNVWERIDGEDVMNCRVSELCDSGLKSSDILVFTEQNEIDHGTQLKTNDEITRICDLLDIGLARAGYKLLDGGADWVIVRNSQQDCDFEIKVSELV